MENGLDNKNSKVFKIYYETGSISQDDESDSLDTDDFTSTSIFDDHENEQYQSEMPSESNSLSN